MAKSITITFRDIDQDQLSLKNKITLIAERLRPDNLPGCHPPKIAVDKGHLSCIFNPMPNIKTKDNSFCLGKMAGETPDWWKPLGSTPYDGSYTLFRADERFVECINDNVGYRTIWYYFDKEVFISSTTQRAIIMFLGTFVPNPAVVPWMLSSGTLGFGNSWDKRIKKMKPNSQLLLNRKTWELSIKDQPIIFLPTKTDREELKKELVQSIETVFSNLDCTPQHWKIPLSGGFDSRAVLLAFLKSSKPETITWGTPKSRKIKGSDAYIAQQLAKALGVGNQYYETVPGNEPKEQIIERFLKSGEGGTDKISGYLDGMNVWKSLFENNSYGVIRGDHALGFRKANTEDKIQRLIGLVKLSHFRNLGHLSNLLSDYQQEIPHNLLQNGNESLQQWYYRLYTSFRAPTILATLNDIKLSYVEVISPLFSRSIIEKVLQIPDGLREEKILFKEWVRETGPNIPFANKNSTINVKDFVRDKQVYEIINDQLHSATTTDFLPQKATDHISKHMTYYPIEQLVPMVQLFNKFKNKLDRNKGGYPSMDMNILGFRAFIISKMYGILEGDTRILKKKMAL